MKDLHISPLRQYHLMLKGATLEPDSLALNLGFPRELAMGSWVIFLTFKPQFFPPYNRDIKSTCLRVVMRINRINLLSAGHSLLC